MKKMKLIVTMGMMFLLSFTTVSMAENYDFPNMSLSELNEVKGIIEDEIKTNHNPSSAETSAVEEATKSYVEGEYGEDNVDWAWFDYTYTKDWNFYTLSTHADITKADGGKAQYNVYSEVFAVNDNYQVVYVKIGEEEILNKRSELITDQRVLKQLGLGEGAVFKEAEEAPADPSAEVTEQTDAPAAEPAVDTTPIAKRGDKSEEARAVQEMLAKLGYAVGTPDGSFGEKTEAAVIQFQEKNGFAADGIVTQAVYDALKAAADAAPEPEEVISVSAVELYNQFENNTVAAKENYKGKTIQVTGTVDSIEEGFWGDLYITLKADEYGFSSVQCFFKKDQASALSALNSGQTVTVKGSDPDKSFNVTLQDCSIVG